MADYSAARKAMVDQQIATSGVTDPRLLSAFRRVPRELFLPADRRDLAYSDAHHPLGGNRFVPPPATVARLLQLAGVTQSGRVLDCWPGTGYTAAILANLAQEVVGIEPDAVLAETARANLGALGLANATVLHSDRPPPHLNSFDTILIEGALEGIPESFVDFLAPHGRLVCLIRNGPVGTATVLERSPEGVAIRTGFNATLPSIDAGDRAQAFVF